MRYEPGFAGRQCYPWNQLLVGGFKGIVRTQAEANRLIPIGISCAKNRNHGLLSLEVRMSNYTGRIMPKSVTKAEIEASCIEGVEVSPPQPELLRRYAAQLLKQADEIEAKG